MTIITIITLFATLTAGGTGQPADLCDVVYEDTGRPILCEPHPDGAPEYEDTVCCNGKSCKPANDGTCPTELDAYFCELGQLRADGYVSCYFEVPDYCDLFPCEPGFSPFPQANGMCCHEGICWSSDPGDNDCEPWDLYWCSDGVTNADGTVTCFN